MPKVGGKRKKARSHKEGEEDDDQYTPKAFVFKKGKCNETCKELALDFRKCFYPHTAMKLEDSNKLAIKSYLKAAKYYAVSHLVAFQQSKQKTFARFIKVGGGEMLFKVLNYCRMKDVFQHDGQPFSFSLNEPLIVLNNFTQNNQVRQIGRSIQEMFPSINLQKINLPNIKRVLSFTYQANKKCIYFRHYKIIVNQGGMKSQFKQLSKQIHSDMSTFKSFSQFLNKVKNNDQNQENQRKTNQNQRQVKLVQIGPRMKLKFISFKEGFGRVQEQQEEYPQEQQKEQGQTNKKIEENNKNKQQSLELNGRGEEQQQNQQVNQIVEQFNNHARKTKTKAIKKKLNKNNKNKKQKKSVEQSVN